jgi:platelet-activating factor acetylhydrolase IB subunit alpha
MARERIQRPGGERVWAALTGQTARVWDLASGETKAELRGHEHVVECAVFAPVVSYAAIRELSGLPAAAAGDRAKAPGAFVATGSRDKVIRLWDAVSGQCLRVLVSAVLRLR